MAEKYEYPTEVARRDWSLLAYSLAEGEAPPCEATIRELGRACGGLPSHCTPLEALQATAKVLTELQPLPPAE